MLLGATGMSPVCINAFCSVHNFCGELHFVVCCFIRYMLPPSRLFFQTAFPGSFAEAKNSLLDMPSYVGRTLCSKYSGYTGMIREAEGEIRLRMETVLK